MSVIKKNKSLFQVTSEAQILRTESSGSNRDFTYRVPEM